MRRTVPMIAMTLGLVPAAWSQQAVSARAGLIQYVEGRVTLDGKEIAPKTNEFVQVEKGQTLATEDGRAEILLTPGAFLRLSENSSFKMITGTLSDTRLEVLSGSAIVEVEELLQDNAITLQSGNASMSLAKHGLYRVDAEGTAHFRVYAGEATVTSGEQTITAKKGRDVELAETLTATKFDTDVTDPFYRWAERRAGYVATANVSSARSVMGGASGSFLSSYSTLSGAGWIYNPWFGMYTYVPWNGFGYSPFGYAIYSPVTVRYIVVNPAPSYLPGSTQRTLSPPSARTVANSTGGVSLGRSSISSASTGGFGASSGGGGGGGGTVADRVSISAPAASSAPAGGGGGGAISAPAGGASRGR